MDEEVPSSLTNVDVDDEASEVTEAVSLRVEEVEVEVEAEVSVTAAVASFGSGNVSSPRSSTSFNAAFR